MQDGIYMKKMGKEVASINMFFQAIKLDFQNFRHT